MPEDAAEIHGRYLIELTISQAKLPGSEDVPAMLRFWLRLGGTPGVFDELLFICPKCEGMLRHFESKNILCPRCGQTLDAADAKVLRNTVHGLAVALAAQFRAVSNDADIKIIRETDNKTFHEVSLDHTLSPTDRAKAMEMVQSSHEVVLYTRGRLEKDLIGGGDLVRRIEALIRA